MSNQLDGPKDSRGAGRAGGLLFVIVLFFAAYLALRVVAGALQLVATALLIAAAIAVLVAVMRR